MRSLKNKHKNTGFTLIEVLIAITIFSTLSFAAYQILQGVLRSGDISKVHDLRLIEVQRGMLLIERDFVQMVARSSRLDSSQQDEKTPLLLVGQGVLSSDSQGIEFNRIGWTNPLNLLPRSNIVRVGYRLKDEQLQRLYYLYPDLASGGIAEQQVILTGVEKITFRFWKEGWINHWNSSDTIPTGIEMTIVSRYYGKLKRVFMLPNAQVSND